MATNLNSSAIEAAFNLGMQFGEMQAHIHDMQKDVRTSEVILAEGRQAMLADKEAYKARMMALYQEHSKENETPDEFFGRCGVSI